MRLAVLSDSVLPTPYPGGHGLGQMVAQIATGLLGECHDVTLFAKVGSKFPGPLVTPSDAEGYQGEHALAREAMRAHKAYPFDAFLDNGHMHVLSRLLPSIPVVNVFHDNFQEPRRNAVLVSPSQKAMMPPPFASARIIPNTLDASTIAPNFTATEPSYALFMGALSEIKQPLLAIEACAKIGLKLMVAGQPLTGQLPITGASNCEYVGKVTGAYKWELLAGARVFLQLGTCEAFGLTTLEAMLCGTPVVAWPAGGSLDLVAYGVSGAFVSAMGADKVQNVADAIERAWYIRRDDVRTRAEGLCSVEAQIRGYEQACAAVMMGEVW